MPSQSEIRKRVTQQIIEALESNLLPWRRPWSISANVGRAANFSSGNCYSGVNPLLLELHRLKFDFQSRWWGTYRQWSDKGCVVKRRPNGVKSGEWGCRLVFAKPITKTVEKDGEEAESKFFLLKSFVVFSADHCEGELAKRLQVKDDQPIGVILDFQPADELIDATGAEVRHGGDSAHYSVPTPKGSWPNHDDGDYIALPHRHRFNPVGSYYETAFHELAHWSELRVGWESEKHGYAMNELVAEMAASFLSAELGIPQAESLENHAAYLKSWLKAMKDDPAYIFRASTQASKASDYLLSFVHEPESVAV